MGTKSELIQPQHEVQRNRTPDGSLEEWYLIKHSESGVLVPGAVLLRVDNGVLARLFEEGIEPKLLGSFARWEVVRKGCPGGTGFEGYAAGLQPEEMHEVISLIGASLYWQMNRAQAARTGSGAWQKNFGSCERHIRTLTETLKSRRVLSLGEAQYAEKLFEALISEFRAWESKRALKNPQLAQHLTHFRGQTSVLTPGCTPSLLMAEEGSLIGMHWPKNPENVHTGVAPFPQLPPELRNYQYLMDFLQEIGRMGAPLTRKLIQLNQEQQAQSPWLKTGASGNADMHKGIR